MKQIFEVKVLVLCTVAHLLQQGRVLMIIRLVNPNLSKPGK